MGRKTEKSQKKQARMKEEKKQMTVSLNNVKKANLLPDPITDFPAFRQYNRNGLLLQLECKRVKDLDPSVVDVLFDLLRTNMEKLYNGCEWGWDGQKKKTEMTEEAAWYLIALTEDRKPVAFSHFRFDMDYGIDVLYVYELQLDFSVRRKGLGRFMSQLLELIAFKNGMKKVVMTVFKHNQEANDFYKSMNYSLDSTSPTDSFDEHYSYLILSKINKNAVISL